MPSDLVLVTGGAGYIGSHLVRKLLARGFRVRVLEKFLYGDQGLRDVEGERGLEIRNGDICSRRDMLAAVKDARAVIALAALVGDPACEIDHDETMRTNFESTKVLLEAGRQGGVQRLVFASSCSVYGANGDGLLDENSWLNPVSLYARTRIMSEELLTRERGDLETIILRLSTVCGLSPRMRFDLMVNTITARAVVDGQVRILGPSQWRPHIHVQDAAEAFLCAAVDARPEFAQGNIYNTGGDTENFTIAEVAEKVTAAIPNVQVEYVDGVDDLRSYRVSFARIREGLGFVPQLTVDDAIREIREALESGAVTNYADDIYSNLKWLRRVFDERAAATA
jgi:nucleoside-diphosphate-sugar epimerase